MAVIPTPGQPGQPEPIRPNPMPPAPPEPIPPQPVPPEPMPPTAGAQLDLLPQLDHRAKYLMDRYHITADEACQEVRIREAIEASWKEQRIWAQAYMDNRYNKRRMAELARATHADAP